MVEMVTVVLLVSGMTSFETELHVAVHFFYVYILVVVGHCFVALGQACVIKKKVELIKAL